MASKTSSGLWQAGLIAAIIGGALVASAQDVIKLADDRQIPALADTEFRFDLGEIPAGRQVRLCLDARI